MSKPIKLNGLNEEAIACLKEAQNYVNRKDNPIYYPRMKELYQEFQKATAWRYLESEDSWNQFVVAAVDYGRKKVFNPFKAYPSDDITRKDGSFMDWGDNILRKGNPNHTNQAKALKQDIKNMVAEYRDGKWWARAR